MELSSLGASIVKPYAIAIAPDNGSAEIDMYGEVVRERPLDDDGNPVEGNYIVEAEFLESLKTVATSGAKHITLRLNSVGGDCFAAITIYNKLMELKADITAKVDGVSMSAAFFIMQAADTIEVFPSSLLMLHTASMCVMGYYNAMDLNKRVGMLDGCDSAMINAIKHKTGKSEREIIEAIQLETYMTGTEAVERGYADVLIEDEEEIMPIVASADRRTVYAAGREINFPFGFALPDDLDVKTIEALGLDIPKQPKTAKADLDTNKEPESTGNNGGGKTTMAKTLAELKQECPDLLKEHEAEIRASAKSENQAAIDAAVKDAVDAERARMKGIDEIAVAIIDPKLIEDAKYGENPKTAEALALAAIQSQKAQGAAFMAELGADFNASGAEEVPPAAAGGEPQGELTPQQRIEQGRADAKKLSDKGGKE